MSGKWPRPFQGRPRHPRRPWPCFPSGTCLMPLVHSLCWTKRVPGRSHTMPSWDTPCPPVRTGQGSPLVLPRQPWRGAQAGQTDTRIHSCWETSVRAVLWSPPGGCVHCAHRHTCTCRGLSRVCGAQGVGHQCSRLLAAYRGAGRACHLVRISGNNGRRNRVIHALRPHVVTPAGARGLGFSGRL